MIIDKVSKYKQLAPRIQQLRDAGESLEAIASSLKLSHEYVEQILRFAETGKRPTSGATIQTAEEAAKKWKYVKHAAEVARRRDVEGQTFEQIALDLKFSVPIVRQAWDHAHPELVKDADKRGCKPARGVARRIPIEKVSQMRTLLTSGQYSSKEIAQIVGVDKSTVNLERKRMQS